MKNSINRLTPWLLSSLLLVLLNSCVSHEELLNFNEGPEFPVDPETIADVPPVIIQADDELDIRVYASNPVAAAPFNLNVKSAEGGSILQGGSSPSYLVNSSGYIDFPTLGRIMVAGLTIEAAKDTISQQLLTYIKDPIVHIRFANFRFTVLGEVTQPATFVVSDEKVTVLEAIGLAGDLTDFGNRNNVLVVREQNGKRTYGRISLRSREVFKSPYFYVRQNDLIYVEPTSSKTAVVPNAAQVAIPWIASLTSIVTLIVLFTR